ncbi:hypothetical protein HK105_200172 [Polyrhizophydium stewartii]|uniref:Uncharacterized protein n=1 Tax=Polyrhizophydium stewartii TaxID=2732419 RepID=A0ABR4NKR0_9FUNG
MRSSPTTASCHWFDYDTFGLDPTGSDLATLLVDRSRLPQEARPPRSRRLTIIDSTNRANDVSKGSHAIDKIADKLAVAHDVLVAPHADLQRIAAGSVPRESSAMLARVLHIQPDAEALRRRLRYTAQLPQLAAMNRGQCTA